MPAGRRRSTRVEAADFRLGLDGIARDIEKILAKKKEMDKIWGELKEDK